MLLKILLILCLPVGIVFEVFAAKFDSVFFRTNNRTHMTLAAIGWLVCVALGAIALAVSISTILFA